MPISSSTLNRPGFTGHDTDPDTQYTYMQQRYYDPRVGRFWSVDPVTVDSVDGNFNRYWYANNNPYTFTDPDGRESGAFYTNPQYQMAQPVMTPEAAGLIADFTPVVGDVKGFVDAYNDPSVASVTAADVGLAGPIGDAAGKLIKGADKAISMEKAIDSAIQHVGSNAEVVMTKGGNVQFTSTTTDAAGNTVTRKARFDVNPSNGNVQKRGPHLNLETQVNGKKIVADPHIPIKPETIRRGDHE